MQDLTKTPRNELDVLARMIAYDFVVIDSLNAPGMGNFLSELGDMIAITEPEKADYELAKEEVDKTI